MNTAHVNTWSWRCWIFQQYQSFALVPNRTVSLVAALGTHGQHGASVPAFEAANTGSCGGRNGGCRNHSRHRPHKFIPVKLEGERLNVYKYAEWLSPCKLAWCRAPFRLCCLSTFAETSPFSPQSQHFKHANILNRSQVVVEPERFVLNLGFLPLLFIPALELNYTRPVTQLLPFGRLHVVFNNRRPDQKPIPSRYQQLPSLACTIHHNSKEPVQPFQVLLYWEKPSNEPPPLQWLGFKGAIWPEKLKVGSSSDTSSRPVSVYFACSCAKDCVSLAVSSLVGFQPTIVIKDEAAYNLRVNASVTTLGRGC